MNLGNMTKEEALNVLRVYYESVSGLQAMKHAQRMEFERVRWSDEKKIEQQKFLNEEQLLKDKHEKILVQQEHQRVVRKEDV